MGYPPCARVFNSLDIHGNRHQHQAKILEFIEGNPLGGLQILSTDRNVTVAEEQLGLFRIAMQNGDSLRNTNVYVASSGDPSSPQT